MKKTTPEVTLKNRKANVSNPIHNARTRFPKIVNVDGNSMLILLSPNNN